MEQLSTLCRASFEEYNCKSSVKPQGAYSISGLREGGLVERGRLISSNILAEIHINFPNFNITPITKKSTKKLVERELITKSDSLKGFTREWDLIERVGLMELFWYLLACLSWQCMEGQGIN